MKSKIVSVILWLALVSTSDVGVNAQIYLGEEYLGGGEYFSEILVSYRLGLEQFSSTLDYILTYSNRVDSKAYVQSLFRKIRNVHLTFSVCKNATVDKHADLSDQQIVKQADVDGVVARLRAKEREEDVLEIKRETQEQKRAEIQRQKADLLETIRKHNRIAREAQRKIDKCKRNIFTKIGCSISNFFTGKLDKAKRRVKHAERQMQDTAQRLSQVQNDYSKTLRQMRRVHRSKLALQRRVNSLQAAVSLLNVQYRKVNSFKVKIGPVVHYLSSLVGIMKTSISAMDTTSRVEDLGGEWFLTLENVAKQLRDAGKVLRGETPNVPTVMKIRVPLRTKIVTNISELLRQIHLIRGEPEFEEIVDWTEEFLLE